MDISVYKGQTHIGLYTLEPKSSSFTSPGNLTFLGLYALYDLSSLYYEQQQQQHSRDFNSIELKTKKKTPQGPFKQKICSEQCEHCPALANSVSSTRHCERL